MKRRNYTMIEIADRFEEAAHTIKRLPKVKVPGYFNTWPPIVRTIWEQIAMDKEYIQLSPPTPEAISKMEETIQWIFLLDEEDERRLVWLRAARVPWKLICWRLGCGRTTAYHMWRVALLKISTRLNAARNGE